ncbi:MAG: lipoyl synthase, partial [Sphingomonadales bacterium]|nr:lipoyl synthase [Sphingomonadales bacterium]
MARPLGHRYLAGMSEADPIRVPRQRKPDWIRVKAPTSAGFAETKRLMRSLNL